MTEKTGWNMTRVTGARCPLKAYLSGGRGIHSLGSLFWPTDPPIVISSFASFSFDSNSITCSRNEWRDGGVKWKKDKQRKMKRTEDVQKHIKKVLQVPFRNVLILFGHRINSKITKQNTLQTDVCMVRCTHAIYIVNEDSMDAKIPCF